MMNCVLITGLLLGYNSVLMLRDKDDEIARLKANLENERLLMQSGAKTGKQGSYLDGKWQGEGNGFGGLINVEVTIEGGNITGIAVLSAQKEDGAYLSMAENIIPTIINAQSSDVDTIGGATFSSAGIKEAVAQALEKAGK